MSRLNAIFGRGSSAGNEEEYHWLSVSDLMAGLMMVFLLISIALMRHALEERDRVTQVAEAYQETQVAIYQALMDEFADDLETWEAEINADTLALTFESPEVLFATGSAQLRSRFESILSDFYPRYLEVLVPFRKSIDEIRIEGHTSSRWNSSVGEDEAYFLNMQLSQDRTRSVLNYLFRLPETQSQKDWVKQTTAAVGFSSSHLVLNNAGHEDHERSRRVSFRILTNAESQIREILSEAGS
ncbi:MULTISPECIES: OmpA family protein [Halomonas]|uniref:Outer membrane protein OmpA-like peptidoglycan-associated protein n=1 Tax=Halomonas ventosae TaxID=229007 RepID=A0A4R6HE65_9GAMM|nr:OmpA family protein [Halomonas ventosae]TDO06075.1 outer membrane protein OmpA-like peptidoglycan-associated protein [Halomonas ventosae]